MKTTNLFKVAALFLFVGMFTACVQDDDYSIPTDLGVIENRNLTDLVASSTELSIQQVKDLFVAGAGATEVTSDVYVKGYVSSSDEGGNFYKEIFIQDSPSNPTAAIKIAVDATDLFAKYNFGREVYINLKDMYVGESREDDGVIAIGEFMNIDGEVEPIRENAATVKMLRSAVSETIVPLSVTLSAVNAGHIGMFVVADVQFPTSLAGELFVDAQDSFDTTRAMEFCNGFDYSTFSLETSTFAAFKDIPLPTNAGTVAGVINNNYNGTSMVMVLNNIEDVVFNDTRCSLLDINNFTNLFTEDFESMTPYASVTGNGWTNYMETGGYSWQVRPTNDSGNSGSQIAQMSAYNSGDASNIAWLISPSVDLDAQGIEFLTFQSSNSFSDNSELEVLISTDWDGTTANVTSATWTALPASVVTDGEFYQNWVTSGSVELTGYTGTAYIAFKYTGGDVNDFTGTFEIDNYSLLVEI